MRYFFGLFIAIIAMTGFAIVAESQTFKVQKFSIGGDGGTDYLTAEPGTGRVFVSRGSHAMESRGLSSGIFLKHLIRMASHSFPLPIMGSQRTAVIPR